MHSSISYVSHASGQDAVGTNTWAGLAFDGIPMFNGLAKDDKGAVETEADTMDLCLTHSSPYGTLHYHSMGPCMKSTDQRKSTTQAPGLVKNKNYL